MQGVEPPITTFKDPQGRVNARRPGSRRLRLRRGEPPGTRTKVGDTVTFVQKRTGQLITAKLLDVHWTVYLANKKASWYPDFRSSTASTDIRQATRSAIRR